MCAVNYAHAWLGILTQRTGQSLDINRTGMLAFDILVEDDADAATLAKRHQKVASYTALIKAKAEVGYHFVPYITTARLKGPFRTSPWAINTEPENESDLDLDWLDRSLRQEYENANSTTLISSTSVERGMTLKSTTSKQSSRNGTGSRLTQKTANDKSNTSKSSRKNHDNQPSQENSNSWARLVNEISTPTSSQGKADINWSCGFVASSLPLQELDITMET